MTRRWVSCHAPSLLATLYTPLVRGQTLAEAIEDELRALGRDAVILMAFIARHLSRTHTQPLGHLLL